MDLSVQRLLTDKLYEKRKQGALELERLVREALANKEYEKIRKIVEQLCHDYAYAVHQPHARNGGLIGLAAASIALGSDEVARYLSEIVPPVLACFTDQDARVRYYACEAMYNIAKVAKGEILLFFNDMFDALCKLSADTELSVKNGAELLDRLVKDIVSESASTYVSVLYHPEKHVEEDEDKTIGSDGDEVDFPVAFSLEKFIPLLEERIHVISPFTRTFLVSWLTLLDTIPDLELIHYLPAFLGGVFKFLGDPNRDVYVATQGLLERFLNEVKKIATIKKSITARRKGHDGEVGDQSLDSPPASAAAAEDASYDNAIEDSEDGTPSDEGAEGTDGDWIPGQDIEIDYPKVLDILLKFVHVSSSEDSAPMLRLEGLSKQKEEDIGVVALRWIDSFFEVSPEDILPFVPRLLSQVLPALSSQSDQVRTIASRVNRSLMDYIVTLDDDVTPQEKTPSVPSAQSLSGSRTLESQESRQSNLKATSAQSSTTQAALASTTPASTTTDSDLSAETSKAPPETTPDQTAPASPQSHSDLDYAAAVNALTLHFINEHEATRAAALSWLIMLHRKAPKKVLAYNDGTFPALLKTLSDPAEAVVTRDLQLLSQISRHSDDSYFSSFMVNLLQLFSTDRKLLEIRGNLIIRNLCMNLMPERIYRTLADCIEKDDDMDFGSIMVQNLNNNLITAPELAELRKRLRNLDSKDGQMFFVTLFKAWCYNAVATFSLCLLAQAYEQAYYLLQLFADFEMTVNMLIQIDKLVQLLESPVFTYLRLQLLEPDRYPYLYKCLYGLLMLLPQSSAFAALKNRLNSVSAIGLLHTPAAFPTGPRSSVVSLSTPTTSGTASATALPGRLGRTRDGPSEIKWPELLEKFKSTQEKARKRHQMRNLNDVDNLGGGPATRNMLQIDEEKIRLSGMAKEGVEKVLPQRPSSGQSGRFVQSGSALGRDRGRLSAGGQSTSGIGASGAGGANGAGGEGRGGSAAAGGAAGPSHGHRSKHSLGNFGKFASGIRGPGKAKK